MTPVARMTAYRDAVAGKLAVEVEPRAAPDLPPLTMAEVEVMSPSERAQAYRERLR